MKNFARHHQIYQNEEDWCDIRVYYNGTRKPALLYRVYMYNITTVKCHRKISYIVSPNLAEQMKERSCIHRHIWYICNLQQLWMEGSAVFTVRRTRETFTLANCRLMCIYRHTPVGRVASRRITVLAPLQRSSYRYISRVGVYVYMVYIYILTSFYLVRF